jgi:hypothetical protein
MAHAFLLCAHAGMEISEIRRFDFGHIPVLLVVFDRMEVPFLG